MKKRIVSILMALCMLVGLFSVAIQAVGTFTYTIQVIIVDADGKLVSVNGLPSKEFDGTTDSGSSYNEDWQWQPNSDGGYTITSNAPGTNVNAFGHLKYPTALWDYDTNDYQFIGMGNMSWDYTNRYEFSEAELSYDWKFENCSFVFSVKSGYRTYILQEKGPAEVEYILNYDANGGEGAPQSQTVKSSTGSATFTVSDVEPTRDGYDFLGWAETDTATSAQYSGGDNYVTSKTNSTLYAVWKVKTIPEPPTKDEIEDLLKDSAVKVDCINSEVIHNDMVYGLLPDSYSIGNVVEGANGNYTIVITVLPDKYVEKYNETYSGHTLSPNPQSETITLEYIGNDWEIASNNSLPVIFTVICTTTTPNPSINDFTKERLTEAPDDVFLDLGDVTVNYNNPVVIPEGGSVTLLYKLTVTGDQGANFIITDDGATLVGSDCGATQATDGKISGTIPASGDANVYVTKTFDADDIDNGNLKNTANIDAGQDTDKDPGVGDAEVNTPASEDTSGTGDDLSINGFTKERLTEEPDDVTLDLDNVTVNYDSTVVIPNGGSVTLLYKLTVTGDQGANFIITDDGATLVGSNCGATQTGATGPISGKILATSGNAIIYVTKTFDADDIENGNLKNTASIEPGQDTDKDPGVGDAEVNTPASEDTSGTGDDLSINGFTKERLTTAPTGVSLDLDNVTVNYDDPVVIPNGGSVTLLYKLTVIGDQGAKFIITDGGATLVGSDCGATQAADGKISGTIPASGEANVYVTKTFDADDIDNGNLKNTANINAGQDTEIDSNVGDATVDTTASEESTPTNEFTLTYDGNAQANGTVENIPSDNNKYVTGDEVSLTVSPEPIHTAVNGSDVIFIGWSLDDADKIYAAGEAYPDIVTEVTFTDSSITVHAVWGYDTNGDDIPDADQVLVTPADITIYVGGSGYTGAVDGTGDVVTSSGLPEPGFYVTLPAELDALLKANEGHMGNGPLDLSNKIIFEANVSGSPLKSWSIEKYDKDNSSTVTIGGIERYIYRIVPAKDQDPVRMQFRDDDGITISDQFNISLDTLYNKYEMSIYPGAIDSNTLYARCVNGSYSDEHYSLVTTSGILTIRGVVNDNVVTTEIEENLPADSDNVTAIAANGTEYFINGSNLVTNSAADVKLLVDDLVESGKNELKDYIIKADNGIDDNFEFEFKYLDLVDTSNGNVWIRPSNDMTIFWPYPEGTDKYTDFAIVHFDGLSRNYDDLDTALDKNDPEYLNVTKTDSGITFTVSSFSPFALVWSTDDSSDDEDDENNPPIIIPINNKLIITKTVSGNLADENDEFLFMIELDRKINGNYDGVIFVDGKAYVTLKGGESVIINDLAPGTAYKVTELDSGEYTVTSTNEIGTIPYTGSVYVNFDNYLNIDAPGLNTTDHIGYLIGRAPGLIFPDANMTRAEVATVFFRLLTDEARAENWTQENQYSDVELNDWYNNAISTISAMGIMNGYPDGTFLPDSPITRAEFITTAVRFFDYTAEYFEGTFIDVDGSEWFADYVATGVELGMIEGYPDGSFLPNEPILRCEVAAIVNRTLGRVPDEAHLLDTSEMIIWDDNLPGSWYYAHIQEASNSHDVEWVVEDGELVEQWTEKLDERDWAALERAWSDAYSAPGAEVVD